jgi:hypothetical protein
MFDAVVNVHDNVALPEPVTLAGVTLHAELSAVRFTTPLNPFVAVTAMVAVPDEPALTVRLVGLAVTVKSWVLYVTVAECDRVPLVPVTVTVYVPAEPEQERLEVPEVPSVTLVGVDVQAKPVLGDTVADRLTVPVNPFTAATVMVEVPLEPATNATEVGLAATVKSFTE